MEISTLFIALALLCVLWGIISCMVIASYLSRHGVRINLIFFRVLVLRYIQQYHDMTAKETGKPGWWFYSYVTSMMLALAFAVVGLALR